MWPSLRRDGNEIDRDTHLLQGVASTTITAVLAAPAELCGLGGGLGPGLDQLVGHEVRLGDVGRGAALGDYDNDGRIDVVVVNINDRPTLLHNETTGGGHWATIRLVGTKSNRDGIGGRLYVTAGGGVYHESLAAVGRTNVGINVTHSNEDVYSLCIQLSAFAIIEPAQKSTLAVSSRGTS